jgi:hypothetical protein
VYTAHLLQLAKFYINDESGETFLSSRIDLFATDSVEEFFISFGIFLLVIIGTAFFAIFWPIYIVGMVFGFFYGVLRVVRYFVRKGKQFKEVAKVLHRHPDSVSHEAVNPRNVDF